MTARRLVEELVAARRSRSPGQAAAVLSADVRYWDCVRGDVRGRAAVAEILAGAPVDVAALAAEGGHAVAELSVSGEPVTEVYEIEGGAVARCRAYLDPRARRGV